MASDSEPEEYEVKAVLDERIRHGRRQFLIKWKDGSEKWSLDKWDEWKDETEMACPDLVAKFREKRRVKTLAEEARKERSVSKARKSEKEEKKPRQAARAASKAREANGGDDTPKRSVSVKPERKKFNVNSDDDEDNKPSSSRSKSRSVRDGESPATSSKSVKVKKRTDCEKLRRSEGPRASSSSSSRRDSQEPTLPVVLPAIEKNSSSSHRDSQGPTLPIVLPAIEKNTSSSRRDSQQPTPPVVIPAIDTQKLVKTELESPEKKKKDPVSAVTGGKLPQRTAQERLEWKRIQETEKNKNKHKNITTRKATPVLPSAGNEATEGEPTVPLFQPIPDKRVKTEMQVEEEMDWMKIFDFDEAPTEPVNPMIPVKQEKSKEREEPRGQEMAVSSKAEENERMEVDEEAMEGVGHQIEEVGTEDGETEETEEKNEEAESSSDDDDDDDEDEDESEDECKHKYKIINDPDAPNGYDQKLKGKIVGHESFEFDNGETLTFMRVLFMELGCSQYIRTDIVEEKDPQGYRAYLYHFMEDKEDKDVEKYAAEYRAARDKAVADEAAAEAARDLE